MILVISSKNSYAAKRLAEEAGIMKYELRIIDVEDLVHEGFKIDLKTYSALYIRDPYLKGSPKYLPQIVKLAKKFKAAGKKVVDANIADGIIGKGKIYDYKKLINAGLPIPDVAKKSGRTFLPHDFPFIAKWNYGFGSKNVFLIKNINQLEWVLKKYPKKELIFQEYVKADYEYKVITVGYKSLPVVLRFDIKADGFRLEYNNYKVIKSSKLPKIVNMAQKAAKVLGRELSKVDILQKGDLLYILEANRFPGLESFEKLTQYNVVKKFLEYLSMKV